MQEIKLDLENFKNIKKKKKCIYVTNDNITDYINSNNKVLLVTENKNQKGKVKRTSANARHRLSTKTSRQKMSRKQNSYADKTCVEGIKKLLPYG